MTWSLFCSPSFLISAIFLSVSAPDVFSASELFEEYCSRRTEAHQNRLGPHSGLGRGRLTFSWLCLYSCSLDFR